MKLSQNLCESQKYDAFSSLFSRYGKGLVTFAKEFGLTRQEAEDVVHDVFLNLWDKMESVKPDSTQAYLFQSIKNRSLNYISRLKSRTVFQNEVLESMELPNPVNEELYIYSELKNNLNIAIEKLPPQQRRVFMMARQENKTAIEIAESLDLSPRTVEKHLELASKSLRQALSEYMSLFLFILLQ